MRSAALKTTAAITPCIESLADVLERAKRSPFYGKKLGTVKIDDYAGWQRLPLTTKADLRDAYPFGLLAVPRESLATYHESSGSTGAPTSSYFTEADWDDIASRFARNAVDWRPGDTVLVKTPYAMVTTAHQAHRAARMRGALVVPADNRSSNMPYARVVRLLADIPATTAWCLPTETLLWAAAARAAGLEPRSDFPALRAFLVAGEAVSEAKRRRISEVWGGVSVHQDYGSTETGSLAGECPLGKLHLWSDRLFAEVLDRRTGRTAPAGIGRLVVTPLAREAMPLVRYSIEDDVALGMESCHCGWEYPVIRVFGRAEPSPRVGGNEIAPLELEEAVYSLPSEYDVLFWRARHDDDRLEIEIATHDEAACEELQNEVALRFGIAPDVRAVPLGALLSVDRLSEPTRFQKPRFLFNAREDWTQGINY
jgi:phenylacetate-CoA ligase